jgi:hypothetical protein
MHYNYGEVRLDGPLTALQDTYVVAWWNGEGNWTHTTGRVLHLDDSGCMLCLILIIIIHIFDII